MLAATQILDQMAWLNTSLPIPIGTWDHLIPVDGAYAAIKKIDGIWHVMLRGSTTGIDWVLDFLNFAAPFSDPILGDIHPGARFGVEEIRPIIDDFVGNDPIFFEGHSLGAMHASQLAGYRIAAGKRVDGLIMFGEPKPGGLKLSQILSSIPVVASYRNADKNGHDAVTDVSPFPPYQHVHDPLTDCWHSPRADDLWGPFRYHHLGHYARAFGCGTPQALSLPT